MISAYYNETFTRVRYVKNQVGKVVTTIVDEFRGRFENNLRVITGQNGEQVVSKSRIFCGFTADVLESDRIFKGVSTVTGVSTGTFTGEIPIPKTTQTYPVLFVAEMKGFLGSHKEVSLG